VRLLLDEHLAPAIPDRLRSRGHDAVGVAERQDLRRAPDDRLWAAAKSDNRAMVTRDVRDFVRLATRDMAISARHPGLVLVHAHTFSRGAGDVGRLVTALDRLLANYPDDIGLAGRIVWLDEDSR